MLTTLVSFLVSLFGFSGNNGVYSDLDKTSTPTKEVAPEAGTCVGPDN